MGSQNSVWPKGQAWCLTQFLGSPLTVMIASVRLRKPCLTPPRPFREKGTGWGGESCPCRPLWVPCTEWQDVPIIVPPPPGANSSVWFPFSTGGCWCKRCRSDAINQEDTMTCGWCACREGAVWDHLDANHGLTSLSLHCVPVGLSRYCRCRCKCCPCRISCFPVEVVNKTLLFRRLSGPLLLPVLEGWEGKEAGRPSVH